MNESNMNEKIRMHQQSVQQHAMQLKNVAHRQQLNKAIVMQKQIQREQLMAAHKEMVKANKQMHMALKKQTALQGALREELVKDGYLRRDEPLHSLRWTNDDLEVNGKKVKAKDARKYKKLQEKLLSE